MYDLFLEIDRDWARLLFGERRNRTVSEVVGTGLDNQFGLAAGVGITAFHTALVLGGAALLAAGASYALRER